MIYDLEEEKQKGQGWQLTVGAKRKEQMIFVHVIKVN